MPPPGSRGGPDRETLAPSTSSTLHPHTSHTSHTFDHDAMWSADSSGQHRFRIYDASRLPRRLLLPPSGAVVCQGLRGTTASHNPHHLLLSSVSYHGDTPVSHTLLCTKRCIPQSPWRPTRTRPMAPCRRSKMTGPPLARPTPNRASKASKPSVLHGRLPPWLLLM